MLVASLEEWDACTGCLKGHPAFILGNGPFLPEDLSGLDDFFTVGVNRILYHYDPTVCQWTDNEIQADIEKYLPNAKAVLFVRAEINYLKVNNLIPHGNSAHPCHRPLGSPRHVAATGNMGTASALWAMSLGCSPIYLLGMSASYKVDAEGGEQTNSYGVSRYHNPANKRRMVKALKKLLEIEAVYPVLSQETLNRILANLQPLSMGREWYVEQFRACHAGVRAGQQPAPAG